MENTCIIYCKCGALTDSEKGADKLAEALNKFEADVYELHDLCAISLIEKDFLNNIEKKYKHKIIIACYPRAVKSLLKQNNIEFSNYDLINTREETVEQIIEKLNNQLKLPGGKANYRTRLSELAVPAWYPVIDESRCDLCGRCFRFCMFGVYQFEKKKSLKVVKPLSCKNNCPACGRNCPTSAIIFPRLQEKTALAGAEPTNERVHPQHKAHGSLLDNINKRNKERKSIFRDGVVEKAEEERRKAMGEHKKDK